MKFKLQESEDLNLGTDYFKGYEVEFNLEDEYNIINKNFKELKETMNSNTRGEVYNALADIAYSNDVSMSEMTQALKWFIRKFYIEGDAER